MSNAMIEGMTRLETSRMSAQQMRRALLSLCSFYRVSDAQLIEFVLASGNIAAITILHTLLIHSR